MSSQKRATPAVVYVHSCGHAARNATIAAQPYTAKYRCLNCQRPDSAYQIEQSRIRRAERDALMRADAGRAQRPEAIAARARIAAAEAAAASVPGFTFERWDDQSLNAGSLVESATPVALGHMADGAAASVRLNWDGAAYAADAAEVEDLAAAEAAAAALARAVAFHSDERYDA